MGDGISSAVENRIVIPYSITPTVRSEPGPNLRVAELQTRLVNAQAERDQALKSICLQGDPSSPVVQTAQLAYDISPFLDDIFLAQASMHWAADRPVNGQRSWPMYDNQAADGLHRTIVSYFNNPIYAHLYKKNPDLYASLQLLDECARSVPKTAMWYLTLKLERAFIHALQEGHPTLVFALSDYQTGDDSSPMAYPKCLEPNLQFAIPDRALSAQLTRRVPQIMNSLYSLAGSTHPANDRVRVLVYDAPIAAGTEYANTRTMAESYTHFNQSTRDINILIAKNIFTSRLRSKFEALRKVMGADVEWDRFLQASYILFLGHESSHPLFTARDLPYEELSADIPSVFAALAPHLDRGASADPEELEGIMASVAAESAEMLIRPYTPDILGYKLSAYYFLDHILRLSILDHDGQKWKFDVNPEKIQKLSQRLHDDLPLILDQYNGTMTPNEVFSHIIENTSSPTLKGFLDNFKNAYKES